MGECFIRKFQLYHITAYQIPNEEIICNTEGEITGLQKNQAEIIHQGVNVILG